MNIFSADVITQFYENHYLLFLAVILVGTFVCTWYLIPKVIWVTREKQLMKPVIERSVHKQPVPTLGGMAFFITMVLAVSLIQVLRLENVGNHLIAAITILFMVGLKDDLVVSTARVKLFGQLIAISFLIFVPELHITTLNGFLGIHEIPLWLGLGLATFVMLAIINSYNLIDGIDGLATVTGMIIGSIFAGIFYYTGQDLYVLLSLSLVGMLGGFLRFNYSRGRNKIFMGDSGALTIGLFIGFLTLKMLSFDAGIISNAGFALENTVLILLGVLFIPFLDTTRSIIIRLMKGSSPFEPDRNHIHHVLLDSGMNHMQATVVLAAMNLMVFFAIYSLSSVLGSIGMTLAVIGILAVICGAFYLLKGFTSSGGNVDLKAVLSSATKEKREPAKKTSEMGTRMKHYNRAVNKSKLKSKRGKEEDVRV